MKQYRSVCYMEAHWGFVSPQSKVFFEVNNLYVLEDPEYKVTLIQEVEEQVFLQEEVSLGELVQIKMEGGKEILKEKYLE